MRYRKGCCLMLTSCLQVAGDRWEKALILEFLRDGDKSVAELMDIGKQFLGSKFFGAFNILKVMVQRSGCVGNLFAVIKISTRLCAQLGRMMGRLSSLEAVTSKLRCGPWLLTK